MTHSADSVTDKPGGSSPAQILSKINPSTGQLLATYTMADDETVRQTVEQSRQAFGQWKNTSLQTRRRLLNDVATALRNNAATLAPLISAETGKPIKESLEADISTAVGVLSYYATLGPKLLKPKHKLLDKSIVMGRVHTEKRYPRGVVGVISPWNFPLAIPASGIAAALMGGNAVILKPSELTPGVGEALVAVFQTALKNNSLPIHAVQLLIGNGRTGAALVNAPIDYVIFTGSHGTGQKVREALQARGKSASLELGGSDPMLILPGADLDAATTYALWGRFANAGQMCAAVKRLLVPIQDYEAVLTLLEQKIKQLQVGPPEALDSHIGPVISAPQLAQLNNQLQDALQRGARVVAGGNVKPGTGYFLEPTLLADVPRESRVLTEEVFGPILPVVAYRSIEEGVAIANGSLFGLTASVFGPEPVVHQVAEQLEAGCVMIHDVGPTNYALPSVHWGGWKQSGPGLSHGEQGLLDTTLLQTVTENLLYHLPLFRKQPWHFSITPQDQQNPAFSNTLLKTFAGECWLGKCHPSLPWQLWKNRSSKKI